jgi:hypothetical protein
MKIGMLWFDNDPKVELVAKVEKAAAYYRAKYGCSPTLCFVHPSMIPPANAELAAAPLRTGGVEVRSTRSVLPNHFWIGINGAA